MAPASARLIFRGKLCGRQDEPDRPAHHRGYGNRITLARDVSDFDTACQVLLALSETVGARLREERVRCNCICVELKDWQFVSRSHQLTLDTPTDSTQILYQNACRLLKEFWDLTPVRLIGLRTTRISEDSYEQLSLFETSQSRKMKELERAVDKIRGKYGIDSIKLFLSFSFFLPWLPPCGPANGEVRFLTGITL